MTINKPYHRCYRPNCTRYIHHPDYAKNGYNFIQSYLYIQKELEKIFEYVEPSNDCKKTYSYKIHELFMLVCVEIEANFKAILIENQYKKSSKDFCMNDYRKINISHKLSDYLIHLPRWNGVLNGQQNGNSDEFKPFSQWIGSNSLFNYTTSYKSLDWWTAYNSTKHNRHEKFNEANLENLLNAVSALLIVISSQFHSEDFLSKGNSLLIEGGYEALYNYAIGGLFRIEYPKWQPTEQYEVDWNNFDKDPNPFQKFNYDMVQ